MSTLSTLLEHVLLILVMPLWLLAGSLDGACHRRLRVEHSSGTPESLMHLAMLIELGAGVGVALLLEINAATLLIIFIAATAHEGTMWLDLAYATSRRAIPWYEQLVHGMQQSMPWVALVSLLLLHPGQALSVFGLGDATADWRLLMKQPPLPATYLLVVGAVALFAVVLPFVAEFSRCLRAAHSGADGDSDDHAEDQTRLLRKRQPH